MNNKILFKILTIIPNPPNRTAKKIGAIIHKPNVPKTQILPIVKSKGMVHLSTVITRATTEVENNKTKSVRRVFIIYS